MKIPKLSENPLLDAGLKIGGGYLLYRVGKNYLEKLAKSQSEYKAAENAEVGQAQGIRQAMNPSGVSWLSWSDGTNEEIILRLAVKIADELRKFGVPVKILKALKQNLFKEHSIKKLSVQVLDVLKDIEDSPAKEQLKQLIQRQAIGQDNFNMLHFMIADICLNRFPLDLLVFKDGSFIPYTQSRLKEYDSNDLERITFETHVRVSLTKLIKDFINDDRYVGLLWDTELLAGNETRLLEMIHHQQYETVNVYYDKKRKNGWELKKREGVKSKIVDVIMEGAYELIDIKFQEGMVSTITNRTRVNT